MLVVCPRISTEASQVAYSVILRSAFGAQGCRLVHVFSEQNHPKALPLKFNVDAVETFLPFLYTFLEVEDQKV